MLGKWGPKYLKDLTASLPRMVGGTIAMNPWILSKDAWSNMDSSELGSHLMMSFMMVKGRGAWGIKNKRQYFADFQPYTEAMHILGINPEGAKGLFNFRKFKDGEGFATGEAYAGSETGQKILTAFDVPLKNQDARNPLGKHSGTNPDLKLVQQFADLYDLMNITKNPNAKAESNRIPFLSEGTVKQIANNLREISLGVDKNGELQLLGNKGGDAFFHAMISMTGQPVRKAMNVYKRMLGEFNELGFDISISQDGRSSFAETRSTRDDGVDLGMIHNLNRTLNIFHDNGDATVTRRTKRQERTMEWIMKKNGMNAEQLKAKVSEIMETYMTELSEGFNNKGKFVMPDNNQFMKFYGSAKIVATNDRLYKIITGTSTNDRDMRLTTMLDEMFMIDGRYHRDINAYRSRIEDYIRDAKPDTPEFQVKADADLMLYDLKTLFDYRKAQLGGETTKNPKKTIRRETLAAAHDQFKDLFNSLPIEFQQNFNKHVGKAYLERIFHNKGMDDRAFKAAHYAKKARLGVFRDDQFHIPKEAVLRQYLRDEAANHSFTENDIQLILKGRKALKDVLGDVVKETDIIPIHEDGTLLTEGVDLRDFGRAYRFLGNEQLRDIIINSKDALEKAYNLDGGAPTKLKGLLSKVRNLIDSLDPDKPVTVKNPIKEVESLINELDVMAKVAKRPDAKAGERTVTEKDTDKMVIILNDLKANINKQTNKWNYDIKKKLTEQERADLDAGDMYGVREAILRPLQETIAKIFEREYDGFNLEI